MSECEEILDQLVFIELAVPSESPKGEELTVCLGRLQETLIG
jgi:hypothetical protein